MAEEDRERIAALITKLESQQAAIQDLLTKAKAALQQSVQKRQTSPPGLRMPERRKKPRTKA